MRFCTGVAVFTWIISSPAFALSDCQSSLTQYLQLTERAAWFRSNFDPKVNDRYLSPFISNDKQASRSAQYQSEADSNLNELQSNCFVPDFYRNFACSNAWDKVDEYTNMIGESLSRTDTLNRNPVPQNRNWSPKVVQQVMDQEQMTARTKVTRYRAMRNEILSMTILSQCMKATMQFAIQDQEYLLGDFRDAAVELVREQFSHALIPARHGLNDANYDCRVAHAAGQTVGTVSNDPKKPGLMTLAYSLKDEGDYWTFSPQDGAKGKSFRFEHDQDQVVFRIGPSALELRFGFLRLDLSGNLVIEFLSGNPSANSMFSIAMPKSGPVISYWSCTPQ